MCAQLLLYVPLQVKSLATRKWKRYWRVTKIHRVISTMKILSAKLCAAKPSYLNAHKRVLLLLLSYYFAIYPSNLLKRFTFEVSYHSMYTYIVIYLEGILT
jgi:hypothetical protein